MSGSKGAAAWKQSGNQFELVRCLLMDCKYCQDEICVNAECPMCCDFCPVVDVPGVCRFEEREEAKNAKQP